MIDPNLGMRQPSAVGKGPKRAADQHQTRFGGDTGGQQHHFNSSMRATFFS